MTDRQNLIDMLERAKLLYSAEDDSVYVKGKYGGADFFFDAEGNLKDGEVIGDQCAFSKKG